MCGRMRDVFTLLSFSICIAAVWPVRRSATENEAELGDPGAGDGRKPQPTRPRLHFPLGSWQPILCL